MKVSLFIVLLQIFRVVIYCNTALRSSNPDTWEGNRAICNFVLISPQSCFRSKGCHEQKATEKISFLNTHNSWMKSPREVRRISHQKQQKADKGVLRSRLWNRLSKIRLSSSWRDLSPRLPRTCTRVSPFSVKNESTILDWRFDTRLFDTVKTF